MAKGDVTNFPEKGADQKVSLRNSKYPQFPRAEAERLRDEHPAIWRKGGNIRGGEAFALWDKAVSGEETPAVLAWIKEREAWAARHIDNFQPAGVIAQIKWGVVGSRGLKHMREVVSDLKAKAVSKTGVWKALDEEKRLVTGVVLAPDVEDGQGDVMTAEDIEEAAHDFMIQSRVIGDSHEDVADAVVVESWIAPVDMVLGDEKITKGTWLMTSRVSDTLWEAIKAGEYTGYSVGGTGVREPYDDEA